MMKHLSIVKKTSLILAVALSVWFSLPFGEGWGGAAFAQDGALKGKILDKANGEPIPFANIIAERGGKLAGGTTTDFDGYYTIKPLSPGTYDVKVTYVGYQSIQISGVIIKSDKISFQNIKMSSTVKELDVIEIIDYVVPLIDPDQTQSGETVTRDDIDKMATRSALGVAATVGGVFTQERSGSFNIRGARGGASAIYIDGIKVRGSVALPQSAIDQVTVITGGIPAKYGDVTGGIINITTRGPSNIFYGGVELLSSGFYIKDKNIGLDPYGYNLLGFSLSGPILKMWDKVDSTRKPLLGFFIAGELLSIKDNSPSSIGVWKVKDDVLDSLRENPLRPSGTGAGSFQNVEFVTIDDLEKVKIRQNVGFNRLSLSGKIDVRTGPNINLTFGGNMDYNTGRSYSYANSLFNYENNGQFISNTWRVYGKFTQKFGTSAHAHEEGKSTSTIKNAYYTLHVDYSKFNTKFQDAKHKDNFFDYGYIGKFTTYKTNFYVLGTDSVTGKTGLIHSTWEDTLYAYERDPLERNPAAANYTDRYYELYDETEDNYERWDQVLDGGGLINGYIPGQLTDNYYNIWSAPGRTNGGYFLRNQAQFRIIAEGSADIKNHAISVGFEYEQRNDRSFNVGPIGLWDRMRLLVNSHITDLDLSNPHLVYVTDANGNQVFADTVNYDRLYVGTSQYLVDYNLRKELGLDPAGIDWIDLNALSPETFSLDMFSADELLRDGSSFVGYYGYDYTGKKIKGKSPTLDDFFTKTRTIDGYNGPTVYERPIPAFEPIYVAGYIQDKFAFKDLIFNIGLRVDRFDANQKVLKDPYLLFPAITAGEVKGGEDRAKLTDNIPDNIGDNYVVYVDNISNPDKIVGFRNDNTWYNEEGTEIPNGDPLVTGTGIQPYLLDPDKINAQDISSNAFEDYEPQVTFMPRIAFSFPISDEALFFAHYDKLSRRPSSPEGSFGSSIARLDPTEYLFIQSQNITINNPNLKPEKTTDYELGFQQKLNNYSSLKISVFYRETRDQIQVMAVTNAFPSTYITFGNVDFATVKGMLVTYDLRRKGNVRIRANYTLQFAEGTGSSAGFAERLVRAGQPNLKFINPLSYDQRHAIVTTVDYRFSWGKDYNGPIWFNKRLFERAGANVVFSVGSGTPYNKQLKVTQTGSFSAQSPLLAGSLFGSRKPWQFRMDARIDKDFKLKWGNREKGKRKADLNIYVQILNVLNNLNVLNVYGFTGNPDDDGFLDDPSSQPVINTLNNPEGFRDLYAIKVNNPNYYGLPRRIRLGMIMGF